MSVKHIGCCGAYCKTCMTSVSGSQCKGCKLGYESGKRDIGRARCKIKLCCLRDQGLETCADCPDFDGCSIILSFHDQSDTKYRKYKEAIGFIREFGYDAFLQQADSWKGPYGKLDYR